MADQTPSKTISHARLAIAALLTGSGIAWIDLLMRPRWAASALGPICSHAGLLAPHCPACYAAAALVAAGMAMGVSAMATGLTPAHAVVRTRTGNPTPR